MAALVRVSSALTGRQELPVPFSLSCSVSEKIAINFPTINLGPSIKLQLRPSNSTTSKFSGLYFNRPRTMATGVQEVLPSPLNSTSAPPSVFDGTTRLYISYNCPYAQRVWITRNCKGLQDKIQLVPIDLQDRPAWYKEKVYPANKVPSLEHNNEVIGESLDLIKYIDSHFEGPSLFPDDAAKRQFAEELLSYTGTFYKIIVSSFKEDVAEAGSMKLVFLILLIWLIIIDILLGAAFDYIETALSKYDDGPFLLGQFSLVDIAYAPFIERFQPFLMDVKDYDITTGRPKLAAWIEEMNNIDAYKQTRRDPKELVEQYKKRFLARL